MSDDDKTHYVTLALDFATRDSAWRFRDQIRTEHGGKLWKLMCMRDAEEHGIRYFEAGKGGAGAIYPSDGSGRLLLEFQMVEPND